MIPDRSPLARTDLAGLLTEAAQSISGVLTNEYPTPATRSYLHPVLGALSAGPQVVSELNDRLEGFFDEPLPATPAGLFVLASYASALGWLTESLAELTAAVDQICTRVGLPSYLADSAPGDPGPAEGDEAFDVAFSAVELAAIGTAAEACGLTPGEYVALVSEAMHAASHITDACNEISSGLLEDTQYVLGEATDTVWIGEGPDSLPTLVRSLLARMETAQ